MNKKYVAVLLVVAGISLDAWTFYRPGIQWIEAIFAGFMIGMGLVMLTMHWWKQP